MTDPSLEKVKPGIAIDAEGNALATMTSLAGDVTGLRVYKAAGGIYNVNGFTQWLGAWLGYDGKLYASLYLGGSNYIYQIGTSSTTKVSDGIDAYVSNDNQQVNLSGRTVFLDNRAHLSSSGNPRPNQASLDVLDANGHRQIFLPDLLPYPTGVLGGAGTKAYVLGKDADQQQTLVCYDFPAATESVVFRDPNFQIIKYAAAANGTVTASALRLSDNTYVVGTIGSNGQLTVQSTALSQVQQILPLQ